MNVWPWVGVGLAAGRSGWANPTQAASAADLARLPGCWASANAGPGSGKRWLAPGLLASIASPAGKATASFALAKLGDGVAVFENPAHDFLQRIIHRVDDKTVLRACIEGTRQGQLKRIEFPMHRVACDASTAQRP